MGEKIPDDLFQIRMGLPEDKVFIYATMVPALYFGCEYFKQIDENLFKDAYQKVIAMLLNAPSTKVSMAVLSSDPDVILGYCIHDRFRVHFVYVKKDWRNSGLGNALVKGLGITSCSHITGIGNSIRKKKNWKFNPFGIF